MDVVVEDLQVRFGTVRALGGVSMDFRPGEVSVLAGPDGAGKSTLMSVLLGLIRPDGGRVRADGRTVVDRGHAATLAFRERLGYLPEAVAFSENLTGRQTLRFFAMARGVEKNRVDRVLERVGLGHAASRSVSGYSRGMRQRLGLGVAILATPDLLILDEPTGGLDQEGITVLWEVLREWRSAGRSVVLSTHELATIERRADRLFVLVDGQVRAIGTPDELRTQSGLPPTVRQGPGLDEVYEALIGRAPSDVSGVH